MNVAAQFGENLAHCRRLADLSQEELSVMASLHRTEISQLERGLRVARIDTLLKLVASLEVSVDELLVGINWQPGSVRQGGFKPAPPSEEAP
jgi:transcriptional regulator with XRE-family HTH domain